MKSLKLLVITVFLLFVSISLAYSRGLGMSSESGLESTMAPKLLYPTTDNIVLTGKDFLEFRWERNAMLQVGHYEFRLFKGYETLESTQIMKQDFSSRTFPIKLPASNFQSGEVYTWSLRVVFLDGRKSDIAFSPFKIIKK